MSAVGCYPLSPGWLPAAGLSLLTLIRTVALSSTLKHKQFECHHEVRLTCLVLVSVLFVIFKTDDKCGSAPQTVTTHVASLHSRSHFAGLLSADEQSGDPNHHDDEEHAGADAFDHTAQRFCRTKTFGHQRATLQNHLRPHPRLRSEHTEPTGSDEPVFETLTSLCDHGQRQEGVGEQRSSVGDVIYVLITQLSERPDAEPADRMQGTLNYNVTELCQTSSRCIN